VEVRFSGKNLSVTAGMREHMREKLTKLDRYAPRLVESHVILKKEKYLYWAELTLSAKNFHAYGEAQSKENIYAAMDQAYGRVEKQLKKFREKVKAHHPGRGEKALAPKVRAARQLIEKESVTLIKPEIVKTPNSEVKPMSIEEASLQLELSDQPFLVFSNASSKQVNVIYKRNDGHHGLIEPGY